MNILLLQLNSFAVTSEFFLNSQHYIHTQQVNSVARAFFVDVLSSFVTSARFTRHELQEYVNPLVESDTEAASLDPVTTAMEAAHALAFRSGLGSSLFAPAHTHVNVEDIKAFASQSFSKDNIAVIGTNIDSSTLTKLVDASFAGANAAGSASSTTPASKYYGGETRLAGTGPQTVFIGFGTTGSSSAELATLAAHLSTTPSVKWSKGLSTIAAGIPEETQVQSVYLPYSDASLFGFVVQGETAEGVKEASKVAVEALKKAAKGLKEEELMSAVAKAKFAAASDVESKEGLLNILGSKVGTLFLKKFSRGPEMLIMCIADLH